MPQTRTKKESARKRAPQKVIPIYFGVDDIDEYNAIVEESQSWTFEVADYVRRLMRIGRVEALLDPLRLLRAEKPANQSS